MHILEAFTSRGLIFLTVKYVFTVKKKKLLICITDKGKEAFFFKVICKHQLFQGST